MKKADKPIATQHHQTFEGIRRFDADGNEYWTARQLARVLEYSEYRHFVPVIERAREACRNSGHPEADHFEDVFDMVEIGSGAKRQVPDVHLSRYACYVRQTIADLGGPMSRSAVHAGRQHQADRRGKKRLAKKR